MDTERMSRSSERSARSRIAALAIGAVIAIVGVFMMAIAVPDNMTLMGLRERALNASIVALKSGAPLLLIPKGVNHVLTVQRLGPVESKAPGLDFYTLPEGDAPGIYIFLPPIGNALGIDDARVLVKWSFIALFALLLLLAPLCAYEITGSFVASLVPPFVIGTQLLAMVNSEHYWISEWVIL